MDSNRNEKFVKCQKCLYSDTMCAFFNANRYCIECLCDHASCPECNFGYHEITV